MLHPDTHMPSLGCSLWQRCAQLLGPGEGTLMGFLCSRNHKITHGLCQDPWSVPGENQGHQKMEMVQTNSRDKGKFPGVQAEATAE